MSDSGDRQTGTGDAEEMSGADGGDGEEASEQDTGTDAGAAGDAEPPVILDAVDDGGVTARALDEDLVDPSDLVVSNELDRSVEETPPEGVADTLALLGGILAHIDSELREERERTADLESRLRRKQADFQNYKKRQKERMEEERERATEDLVERLLDVRDNLARALDTDEDADIRSGIESTLAQLDRELDRENVDRIEPAAGDAIDPVRHEVLATVPSGEPENAIADVHRPGYEMAGKVLRPAQVTVSDGTQAGDDGASNDTPSDTGDESEDSNEE